MSASKKIVTAYSKSLFQNISNSKTSNEFFNIGSIVESDQKVNAPNISIVGEELTIVSYAIKTSTKLNAFIKNPTYREQQKLSILVGLFPGLTVTTKSFLKVLTDRSHLSLLGEVSDEFNALLRKFNKVTKVKISVATPLNENYGSLLLEKLKELTTGIEIILDISYNPKLLGGLVLEYNSNVIDASLLKEFSLFFSEF